MGTEKWVGKREGKRARGQRGQRQGKGRVRDRTKMSVNECVRIEDIEALRVGS